MEIKQDHKTRKYYYVLTIKDGRTYQSQRYDNLVECEKAARKEKVRRIKQMGYLT